MIWDYHQQMSTSINPLPIIYESNSGIKPEEFVKLAIKLGMLTVGQVNMSYHPSFLIKLLNDYGPIWAAGKWYGFNHIIVVTGADQNGKVYVNDPGPPAKKEHDISWFNDKIAKEVQIPMMYLPARSGT
jgi:hypothetical protein